MRSPLQGIKRGSRDIRLVDGRAVSLVDRQIPGQSLSLYFPHALDGSIAVAAVPHGLVVRSCTSCAILTVSLSPAKPRTTKAHSG